MVSDLLDAVIDALAHLIGGGDTRRDTKLPKPLISKYDGFELIHSGVLKDDTDLHIPDGLHDVPFWPMDARAGVLTDGGQWIFKNIRTAYPKDWRGKLKLTPQRMIEVSETGVMASGETLSSSCPYGIINGKLVEIFAHNHPGGGLLVHPGDIYSRGSSFYEGTGNDPLLDYKVGQAVELRREYLWSVLIGEDGIPRARFSTDPIGIREAFRLRDIPPGRARRAALRHWVREHWRKNRTSSDADRAFVAAYLRGATTFAWDGLSCEIQPSREDMRKAKKV